MDATGVLQNKKILVIDDNYQIVDIIRESLAAHGSIVFTAKNGKEGLRSLYRHRPELVILDIAMPVMDGWETCRRIREITAVPIIMVTGMVEEDDIVAGLKLGAVDYITKPFSPRILQARVLAALRQAETTAVPEISLKYKDSYLSIDLTERHVTVEGTAVHLSKTEFALLEYLLLHHDQPLPYQKIVDSIWGESYHDGIKNLYVFISQLRQKIERNSSKPEYILTVYGIGYRFKKKLPPDQSETAVTPPHKTREVHNTHLKARN